MVVAGNGTDSYRNGHPDPTPNPPEPEPFTHPNVNRNFVSRDPHCLPKDVSLSQQIRISRRCTRSLLVTPVFTIFKAQEYGDLHASIDVPAPPAVMPLSLPLKCLNRLLTPQG